LTCEKSLPVCFNVVFRPRNSLHELYSRLRSFSARIDDVRVPEENLVGTRGADFLQLMQFFDETRTAVAARGVGIAKGAAERALAYAQEREQFASPSASSRRSSTSSQTCTRGRRRPAC